MNILEKAREFSHQAHDSINQKRKYSNQPYWIHVDAVAKMAMDIFLPTDGSFDGDFPRADAAIAAAFLHDTLEDVAPDKPEFGPYTMFPIFKDRIMMLVLQLTNVYTSKAYPYLTRLERKTLEHMRLAGISDDAQTIKLLDIVDNTKTLAQDDPKFAKIYLAEKKELLPFLNRGHYLAFKWAQKSVQDGLEQLAGIK